MRLGSSVRGAIDMVRLADGLARLRAERPLGRDGLLDAAVASGRVRVHEDQDRSAEEVIAELLDRALSPPPPSRRREGPAPRRTAPGRTARRPSPAETRRRVADQRRQTLSRDRLAAAHAQFAAVSPQVGRLDEAAFAAALARDADVAAGTALARRGNGRWLPATSVAELAGSLQTALA